MKPWAVLVDGEPIYFETLGEAEAFAAVEIRNYIGSNPRCVPWIEIIEVECPED
jgi:hypothetical protein